MAPPGLEADPDGEAQDTVVDNDIMSSSRTRARSSRSASGKRDGAANGDAAVGDTAPVAEDAADAGSVTVAPVTVAPLPADTVGKAKTRAAGTATEADKPAEPAETA